MGTMLARCRALALSVVAAIATCAIASTARADDDSWFDESSSTSVDEAPPPTYDAVPPAETTPPPKGLAGVRHASTGVTVSGSADIDAEDANPEAVTRWHPVLAPYGRWVDDPNYGLIWVPARSYVGVHFAPYVTSGHWELDVNSEWVWVSDYPFGDVVFHYGRWVWIDPMGWAWIPGNRYASAWVVWRVPSDDYAYVGWAPAPVTFVWIGGQPVYCSWYHPVGYVYVSSYYAFSYHPTRYIVRDPALRQRIAVHTRRLPANPRTAAYTRTWPTLEQARVPRQAAPITRRPATFASPMVQRNVRRPAPAFRSPASRPAPSFRTPAPAPYRAAPSWRSPRPDAPRFDRTPRSTPHSVAPMRRSSPRHR